MPLHKAKQVNIQEKPYLVKSRLEREMEEEQEPKEYHYETESEMLADRGMKYSDFI